MVVEKFDGVQFETLSIAGYDRNNGGFMQETRIKLGLCAKEKRGKKKNEKRKRQKRGASPLQGPQPDS